MDRIDTLLDLSRVATSLDPSGTWAHTVRLRYNPDEPSDERMTRIGRHVGRLALDATPDFPSRARLAAQGLETYGKLTFQGCVPIGEFNNLDRNAALTAKILTPRFGTARKPQGVMRASDGKLVILMDGAPHTDRSMFSQHAMVLFAAHGTALPRGPIHPWRWSAPLAVSDEWMEPVHPHDFYIADMELAAGAHIIARAFLDQGQPNPFRPGADKPGETYREFERRVGGVLDGMARELDGAWLQADRATGLARGSIATAFTPMRHHTRAVQRLAQASRLRSVFADVEYDDDIDKDSVGQMEQEIRDAVEHLPNLAGERPVLRVRKLGKHCGASTLVTGMFSPSHNCIVLDDGFASRKGANGLASFCHEYAHAVDHHTGARTVAPSMSGEFRPVLDLVREDTAARDLPASARDYLNTPTEAFARAFEYWLAVILECRSSVTKTVDQYATDDRYRAFHGHHDTLGRAMRALFPDQQPFHTLDAREPNRPRTDFDAWEPVVCTQLELAI